MVDIEEVKARFRTNTSVRLKPRTLMNYIWLLERFDRFANLSRLTKDDLTGKKGKRLILDFLERHITKRSWKFKLSALKSIYISGFEYERYDWPIEPRRDLPRFPATRRRETPPDEIIRKWNEAMRIEPNIERRLIWLLIAQHGWRQTHLLFLNWEDVKIQNGRLYAVLAQSSEFKTQSPIIARLVPDVADALQDYSKGLEKKGPIFQKLRSKYNDGRDAFLRLWQSLQKKHDLPYLRPNGLRHWVSHIGCDVAKLSKPALASLMGHDSSSGGWMSDWYNSPRIENILKEQAIKFPSGPLGYLDHQKIELAGIDDSALELLGQYLNDRMGTREFSCGIEIIKERKLKEILQLMK